MKNESKKVETVLLSLVVAAGLVPLAIAAVQAAQQNASWTMIDAFMRRPYGAIAYAVLFGFGAILATRVGQLGWALLLLPVLTMAVWPVFRGTTEELPVPRGAVVAFLQLDKRTESGCPPGWSSVTALAGKFPLGAGQGEQLSYRALGDSHGQETVTLSASQIPDHRHEYEDFFHLERKSMADSRGVLTRNILIDGVGTAGDMDNTGWYRLANTLPLRDSGEPHENMPPFYVVLFCEFVGAAG